MSKFKKTIFKPTTATFFLNRNLAIGTAGVVPHLNYSSSPLRLYNVETFKEIQVLMPSNEKLFKRGAGILALSYIDEKTLLAAGYDTFIRVFDLRTQTW